MMDDVTDKSFSISSEYTNITVEAELLILDIDGVKYFDKEGEIDFITFSILYFYAIILRRPEVIELLNKKYGRGGWQKQNKDLYQGHTSAIYEAQGRNIVLYKK